MSDVTHRKRGLRILGFEKSQSWVPVSERESRDWELGEARRLRALRAPCVGWVESWRFKSSQHRKIVPLSPHIEKPLNSKRWIKVSCLNQFRVFGFPTSISHICLFGYVTKGNLQILGNTGSWHYQTSGNERKRIKKSISREPESYSRQNYIAGT